jgi:hypothetical protein
LFPYFDLRGFNAKAAARVRDKVVLCDAIVTREALCAENVKGAGVIPMVRIAQGHRVEVAGALAAAGAGTTVMDLRGSARRLAEKLAQPARE